jgi:NAD+ kinase
MTPGAARRGTGAEAVERPVSVRRAGVVTHGQPHLIGDGLERLARTAERAGVELVFAEDERRKHGLRGFADDADGVDIVVVLGGDGSMLRALDRFLGTDVPVIGVNFGQVGFLTSIAAGRLETELGRAFAGDYRVVPLATLVAESGDRRSAAVNDVVARSADIGRMVELGWSIGDEDLGTQRCDGIICATPAGSTAYNLSNGGPVLVWGLEAMAISFVAPHSLHARPIVVPRGLDLRIENRTPDVEVTVLLDGSVFAALDPGAAVAVRLGERRSLLATTPESTFFRRYRDTFVD